MAHVAVVDFGTGNLRSVSKAIEHVAPKVRVDVTDDPDRVQAADHVVFPGQGAIGTCIRAIDQKGLSDALMEALRTKPFLGICLGLQALYRYSEEHDGTPCLGVLDGEVKHLTHLSGVAEWPSDLKIPHMGWNTVRQNQRHPLWSNIGSDARFYFVHSYCAVGDNNAEVLGITEYGGLFTSAAGRDNLFATQFHPEKSQRDGLTLLRNFVQWDGAS
jgi:glutamine amidotransferase